MDGADGQGATQMQGDNESTSRFGPAMIRQLLRWIASEDPVLFATVSAEIVADTQ